MKPSFFDIKSPYKVPESSLFMQATWQEYLEDCGGEVIVENFIHARSVFNKKYEHN